MKKNVLFLLVWGTALSLSAQSLVNFVDPFIGTDYTGHTYPAATTPFGLVQVGPDNGVYGWEFCSGYHGSSNSIMGFSHTHLSGTGCPDMGDILLMPFVGDIPFKAGKDGEPSSGYQSAFSRDTEKASPGYYSVILDKYNILAEMTATPRVGFHRYTYPKNEKSGIIIDLEHGIGDKTSESYIRVIDNQTVVGMRRSTGFVDDHRYYFCARFSKPFSSIISFEDERISDKKDLSGKITKLMFRFSTEDREVVQVKVGLSTTGEKGAIDNLNTEVPGWDFAQVLKQTESVWENYLKRIEINPMDEGQKISFYTSLYHALLMPNLITDVDGKYMGWDQKIHQSTDGNMYTNFSLWDTYRALHPFLIFMYPQENSRFVRSMLERHKQVGLLPTNEYGIRETWCMIGNHAIPVIADVLLKGFKEFDAKEIYQAAKTAATKSHEKSDWETYMKYGYYPFDIVKAESVSRTLESGYDDYCIAKMAKVLGKKDDYNYFTKRAGFYKNLFDSRIKLMRGKDSNGNWRTPFNSFLLSHEGTSGGDFTEGNSWQYTWHIQHDVPGLIKLMGGNDYFTTKLDSLFFIESTTEQSGFISDVTGLIGQYAHGNEPSHHIAYLYPYANRPDRTAEIVREVFDRFYLPKRDGLCGNDDCGQMSAWYIFSALGFYPVDPVSGEYVIGAPQVHEMKLQLPNGKTFTMKANNLSTKNKYVKSIKLNGKPLKSFTITYDQLMKGGQIEFEMTADK